MNSEKSGTAGVASRLKRVRAVLGLNQQEMAARIGTPIRSYHRYEAGERPPPIEALETIGLMGFNLHWLLTGEGEMQVGETLPSAPQPAATPVAPMDAKLMGLVFEGILAVYAELNARIDHRSAGELATRIYGDVVTACEGSDDPDERKGALKMALMQLRRDLRSTDGQTRSKSQA